MRQAPALRVRFRRLKRQCKNTPRNERRGDRGRAVLIVTDNLSLNYRIPGEEVVRAFYAADAALNAILIRSSGPGDSQQEREVKGKLDDAESFLPT